MKIMDISQEAFSCAVYLGDPKPEKRTVYSTGAKVKIVAGSREQRSIRASAKLLHRAIPGSQMEILPGLRHGDLSLNKPEQYAKILTDWIGETL